MIIRVGARQPSVSCVSTGRSRTARKHTTRPDIIIVRYLPILYSIRAYDGVFITNRTPQCLYIGSLLFITYTHYILT